MARTPAELRLDAVNMIEAATSAYIMVPVLVSLATPTSRVRVLPPGVQRGRTALQILCFCACIVSGAAWLCWRLFGFLDQPFAGSLAMASPIFSFFHDQGTWVQWYSWSFIFLSTAIFFSEDKHGLLGCPQPWPHLTFRFTAMFGIIAGLAGGLLIRHPCHLLYGFVISALLAYPHAYMEFHLVLQKPDWVWTASYCLRAMARTFLMALLCAYLLVVVPPKMCSCGDNSDIELVSSSGEGSSCEDGAASDDAAAKDLLDVGG